MNFYEKSLLQHFTSLHFLQKFCTQVNQGLTELSLRQIKSLIQEAFVYLKKRQVKAEYNK